MEYYIGDNIKTKAKDITITDKTYKRMADGANRLVYKYKCNICGFDCNEFYYGGEYVIERWFTAFQLERNAKCSCCASKAIKPGINSISTTNPELVEYFVNKHNSEIYSLKSNAHTDMCCPHCGVVKNMCIADLHNQGFSCPRCSDSLSVGERIMYIILSENNISFVKEYVIAGANYRYDFYIKDKNMIIEINGKQHYDGGFGTYDGGKNLEEEKLNDANKKKFALDNGIENYVYIDCRKSNVDYIINSVYDSGIIDILGIENIDENHIAKTIHTHSITKDICDLYNSDDTMSIKDICDILHFDRTTVREHLKSGAKLGWCDYSQETYRKSKRYASINYSIDARDSVVPIKYGDKYFKGYTLCARLSERVFGNSLSHSYIYHKLKTGVLHDGCAFEYVTKEDFNEAYYKGEECYGSPYKLCGKQDAALSV